MSAPVAPKHLLPNESEVEMSATNVHAFPQEKDAETLSENLIRWITMTVQKLNAPSVTVSPAVIGLLITIIIQFGASVWWASSTSKELEHTAKELQDVKSEVATMKVYIDTSREKQVKLEAAVETLEKQQTQNTLLLQMKGVK